MTEALTPRSIPWPSCRLTGRRTSSPTRRCAGAPAAATTRSWRPCRRFMPELGLARENMVFVSGIGCSSRFPYYMNTYGMHSIHGRAPAIATGLADLAPRPERVGGHRRRRRAVHRRQPPDPRPAPQREPEDPAVQQPDLRPDQGAVLPHLRGRQDHQVDADGLARRARSTRCRWRSAPRRPSWPARIDSDRKHLQSVLRAAAEHPGTALVEIYQNCNIFNDGAFDVLKERETAQDDVHPRSSTASRSASARPPRTARHQGRRPRPASGGLRGRRRG